MSDHNSIIIVRKGRKHKHASHGGAWKVAFADFTLAMMALFMVLWIVQVTDQEERQQIVQYLKGELLMDGGSPLNPFDLIQSDSIIPINGGSISDDNINRSKKKEGEKGTKNKHQQGLKSGKLKTVVPLEVLAKEIDDIITHLSLQPNVKIEIVPSGIRILVHDNSSQFMFTRGSANIQPYFEDLLLTLGELLGGVDYGLSISGHTDSTPFAGNSFTNWELSAQRALIARQILQAGGVNYKQVIQVAGYADQTLYVTNNPKASANRRVEILVLTKTAERELIKSLTGTNTPITTPDNETEELDGFLNEAKTKANNNLPRDRYSINEQN